MAHGWPFRRIRLLLAVLAAPLLLAQSQPEFVLLGAVHDMHMNPGMHYSLPDLRHEIEAIKPDLICVEIEPEAFDSPMEGYFPPEAAFIAALAPELHARVLPTDWRIARAWQARAEQQTPKNLQDRIAAQQARIQAEFQAAAAQPSIFEFVHGPFQTLADQQFTQIIGENSAADLAGGAWHERNRRIVENALAALGDARRVLFVYGGAHLPQIARELAERGWKSRLATREFQPCGIQPLPPAVLARWRRNLDNLRAIQSGRLKVTPDGLRKVSDSHRIADLEQALRVYGGQP